MKSIKPSRATHPNGGRYAIVVGRWNAFVVESLLEGAVDTLLRHGVDEDDITIVRAPGALKSRWW